MIFMEYDFRLRKENVPRRTTAWHMDHGASESNVLYI
jgi:hypothetical protein